MYSRTGLLALAAYISAVTAASQGFNYGSTDTNGNAKTEADFIASFKTAKALVGTNGAFTSARLYTMLVRSHKIMSSLSTHNVPNIHTARQFHH